jgi:hypothetical protein
VVYVIESNNQDESQSAKAPTSLILGLVGWLPLGVSLFAALADTSNAVIAIPLVAAGVVAISGVVLAVRACQKAARRSGRCVGLRQGLMSVPTIEEIGARASLRNPGAAQSDLLWTRDVAEVISIPGRPERVVTGSDDQQLRS